MLLKAAVLVATLLAAVLTLQLLGIQGDTSIGKLSK
jgi:hypothetical protein